MAETYGPFDSGTFMETGWYALSRAWAGDGVIYVNGFNDLKLSAGGGLNGSLAIGRAAVAGGFLYDNSAAKAIDFSVPAPPTTAGQTRLDLCCLRCDFAANTITAVQKAGVASASPVLPSLQRDSSIWEVPIAQVLIPTNAVALGTITDLRSFAYIPPHLSWCEVPKTAAQGFATTVLQKATWTATGLMGNATFFDDANDRLIAPVNGLYAVSYYAPSTGGTSQTGCMAFLYKNGSSLAGLMSPGPGGLYYPSNSQPKHYLAAGDYWEAFFRADGNSTNMVPTASGRFRLAYEGPGYLV